MLDRLDRRRGVLSSVFFDEHAQEQEVRDPDGADVDDDAGDDLVDLPADARARRAGGRRSDAASMTTPTSRDAEHDGRAGRAGHDARDDRGDAGADEELALDGDVEHAAALGQDAGERAERDRRRELEAVPAKTPVRLAVLPASRAAMIAATQNGDDDQRGPRATGTRARGRAGRSADDAGDDAGQDPQDADGRRDGPARSPPCLSIQNENVAGVSKEPVREVGTRTGRGPRTTTPRIRAVAQRRALGGRVLVATGCSTVGLAAVMPAPLRSGGVARSWHVRVPRCATRSTGSGRARRRT